MVKPPGVVTGRYGTIGNVFFADTDFWPLNTTLWVSDFHGNDARFVYYLLQRLNFAAHSGKSGVPGVNRNDLHTEVVPLPASLAEQRRIASALSDGDELIATLRRLIGKKESVKHGMMQSLLTGDVRLPGFCKPWRQVRLGDEATMGSGGTPLSTTSGYYGGGVPWVSISDMTRASKYVHVTEKTLSSEGVSHSAAKLYDAGVVLYAMYASLGECALPAGRMSSSQAILGILPGRHLDREYLYYHLCSRKRAVRELGQQGTQSNLNAGMVRNFTLPLPEPDEQRAIASVLSDSDREIETLHDRLTKAAAIQQGMMQHLLTGRTRLAAAEALV